MNKFLDYLLSPKAIRERCNALYGQAIAGKTHFEVRMENLDAVSDFVAQVTLENYPDLKIPFHSRWGHFQAGKVDRLAELEKALASLPAEERARAKLDLAIVSVLLDAGAGMQWKFTEASTGYAGGKSEGLAVASFRMFLAGAFSSDPARPYRADAKGLQAMTAEKIEKGFQTSGANPLVGVEGRAKLLQALGRAISNDGTHFPPQGGQPARPGNIFDFCVAKAGSSQELPARELLLAVLLGLGPIWPGRIELLGTNLGDVWSHSLLGKPGTVESFVPFHKLSQWLTYSLIEPLEAYGLRITGVGELTGLAEYRNGGLLLDRGLIRLRDPRLADLAHEPGSELVIEWRALTVVLLEKIAERVRARIGKSETEMPLAKILEGGTWWAGRRAAAALRADGGPPLKIVSDGTVF